MHEQKRPRRITLGLFLCKNEPPFCPRFEIRSRLLTFADDSKLFNDAKRRRFSPAF